MVRWLEANGYDVSYTTGVDSDRRGTEILEHKVYLSVGHDEYWSARQRANVEQAREAGIHLAFFSGNDLFWKTRWEASVDGSNGPHRTLVSYKETHANGKVDPLPDVWTGTWRDPRFSPPADGGRPENALTGTIFTVLCCTSAITVPQADGLLRFWRHTGIADLGPDQVATLAWGTLGYEWNEDLDNGSRPAGLVRLSSTTLDVEKRISDHGTGYAPGKATHSLTLYRHQSGAMVFSAGTIQWSWGLDATHDGEPSEPDARMQQATVNLFADMGVQPATLRQGLVATTASTDTTAPTSRINSVANGSVLPTGVPVTVLGDAEDVGGHVAGVEVSVDGGTNWHPANGRQSWQYAWTPSAPGRFTIRARAVDDSGNLEASEVGVNVNVQSTVCPCTIWTDATPRVASVEETDEVELGVRFRSDVDGYIVGIRFYKSEENTGTHSGHLWTSSGGLLASTVFSDESSAEWQEATFAEPVHISAGTTYVASYHTAAGRFSADRGYFDRAEVGNGPLRALASSVDEPNGVFKYGPSGFPTQSFNASNYWVDVVFTTSRPPVRPSALNSEPVSTTPMASSASQTDRTPVAPISDAAASR